MFPLHYNPSVTLSRATSLYTREALAPYLMEDDSINFIEYYSSVPDVKSFDCFHFIACLNYSIKMLINQCETIRRLEFSLKLPYPLGDLILPLQVCLPFRAMVHLLKRRSIFFTVDS